VSIDLTASLPRPITLAASVDAGRTRLAHLLGLPDVPELAVLADRRYEQGRLVSTGRRLDTAELTGVSSEVDQPGAGDTWRRFDVDVVGRPDRLWLQFAYSAAETGVEAEAVVSPCRTAVGVVVATALTIAIADLAEGNVPRQRDPNATTGIDEPAPGSGCDPVAAFERRVRRDVSAVPSPVTAFRGLAHGLSPLLRHDLGGAGASVELCTFPRTSMCTTTSTPTPDKRSVAKRRRRPLTVGSKQAAV
jgi:hypothetical protein